jgi:membrane protein
MPLTASTAGVILKPLPLLFTTAALTLLYALVPARPVPWRNALAGAAVAALAFEAAKHGFAFYVTRISTYELVYGTLAALPVFLIWIYLCWLIVLAGAAITATLTESKLQSSLADS